MLKFGFILGSLTLIICVLYVSCFDDDLTEEERFALTRDGFGRKNPDEILNGFFATWPLILLILAAVFAIGAIFSFFTYITGICRNPDE